jgi:hypothetical protein
VLEFYVRTVLALVVATLTTTLGLRLFVESPLDELTLRLMGGHASVHVQAIARVPPAERRGAVQELSASLGYPVHTQTNKGGQAVRTEWRGPDLYVLAPVPDTPGLLPFGPLPYGRAAAFTQALFVALLFHSSWPRLHYARWWPECGRYRPRRPGCVAATLRSE